MKNRIFYFNINYSCNNDCIFCLSHNVSKKNRELSAATLIYRLKNVNIKSNELIVINGGEPTIHSQFYDIINEIKQFNCKCNIYSNGVEIFTNRIYNKNIKFIIPIHGNRIIHDYLTRNINSYIKTLQSFHALDRYKIQYDIKFIITSDLIKSNLNLNDFIFYNDLNPQTIYIARLNTTNKSIFNSYLPPNRKDEIEYILNATKKIQNNFDIKFLDVPLCYIETLASNNENLDISNCNSNFYFNDFKYNMRFQKYNKQRLYFDSCLHCNYNDLCCFLSKSYFLLTLTRDGKVHLELE